ASTLPTQRRASAGVSTAVTRGDLTQRITVDAEGEIAELKDNINQMIVTLRETTRKNAEQGWLDSNLARVGGLLQGQRDLSEVCRMIMAEVTPLVDAQLGAFFLAEGEGRPVTRLRLAASYGYTASDEDDVGFAPGEGLVGQASLSRRTIRVSAPPSSRLVVRTPLNSMLLLSRLLADNPDESLSVKQVEFAQTIHSAGSDLLALIDDILDLSKIEAGRMDVDPSDVPFEDVRAYVEQAFAPQA